MRKLLLVLALLATVPAMCQEGEVLKNKNGVEILPQKGDIALGLNMIPFFDWMGNMFNNSTNNDFSLGYIGNQNPAIANTIFGKYMLSTRSALRVNLGLAFYNGTMTNLVYNDFSNDPLDQVQDSYTNSTSTFNLAVGYEMRRGKRRLQGFFGGDFIVGTTSETESYIWGNNFATNNITPTSTTNFNTGASSQVASRTLSTNTGLGLNLGLRAFVGVEYFVAPSISLGFELGWGVLYTQTFTNETVSEMFSVESNQVISETIETSGNATVSANINNFNGAITMLFYF